MHLAETWDAWPEKGKGTPKDVSLVHTGMSPYKHAAPQCCGADGCEKEVRSFPQGSSKCCQSSRGAADVCRLLDSAASLRGHYKEAPSYICSPAAGPALTAGPGRRLEPVSFPHPCRHPWACSQPVTHNPDPRGTELTERRGKASEAEQYQGQVVDMKSSAVRSPSICLFPKVFDVSHPYSPECF